MTGRHHLSTRDGPVRRLLDVLLSGVGLVLLAPLGLAIGLAILVTAGRPVLFRQRRSGRGGMEFDILKFRTMCPPRWPGEPDSERRTVLGTVLRWTSLDELPQLVNILRGDMSVIGPRPTLPEQVRAYSPRQRGRLSVRPGLTGWAQVRGRNSLSWAERIELDLWYIDNRCLRLDLIILLRTVVVLLWPRGVTGIGGVNPEFAAPTKDEALRAR